MTPSTLHVLLSMTSLLPHSIPHILRSFLPSLSPSLAVASPFVCWLATGLFYLNLRRLCNLVRIIKTSLASADKNYKVQLRRRPRSGLTASLHRLVERPLPPPRHQTCVGDKSLVVRCLIGARAARLLLGGSGRRVEGCTTGLSYAQVCSLLCTSPQCFFCFSSLLFIVALLLFSLLL